MICICTVYILGRKEETAIVSPEAGYAACPRDWIGFGSKCFYFSEHTSNWTSSQTSCMELGANLTHFDSLEELVRKDREFVCCLLLWNMYFLEIESLKLKLEEGSNPSHWGAWGTCYHVKFVMVTYQVVALRH